MTPIQQIYALLLQVLPNKVFYGTNVVDETDLEVYPFIVYQETSSRAVVYADNQTTLRLRTFQITLVTGKKDPALEHHLEIALTLSGLNYQMVTEYLNQDGSVNRVYEIKMEDLS